MDERRLPPLRRLPPQLRILILGDGAVRQERQHHFKFDTYDTYQWYLNPDSADHPNYDSFWKKESFTSAFRNSPVPILNVAGWWDQEDPWGPWKIYSTLAKNDPQHNDFMVADPWNHEGSGL